MGHKIKNRSTKKGSKFKIHDAEKSVMDEYPVFSLCHVQKKFCLSKCNKEEKSAFADTMLKLSQSRWRDLTQSSRHGIGFEKINHSCIKSSIPEAAKTKNIIAFRFCGKAPMVGFREQQIFHIVWLDRAFSLYDHG